METPKPPHQRPELAEFWDHRFRNGVTPWDAGGVPEELQAFAAGLAEAPRTLVPGCGTAREARWLLDRGWPITALDFSPAAIEAARPVIGPHQDCLLLADFFSFDMGEPFDLVYERAFLCALPRSLWPAWAARLPALIRPGGLLAGYFFFRDELKGPPFGTSPEELEGLLTPAFVRLEDREAANSIPVFAGGERWQVWQRR